MPSSILHLRELVTRLGRCLLWRRSSVKKQALSLLNVLSHDRDSMALCLQQAKETHRDLDRQFNTFQTESQKREQSLQVQLEALAPLEGMKRKYLLLSKILSAKPAHNERLQHFRTMLRGDFFEFANLESSLAEEAQAWDEMQSVERELTRIVSYSPILSKTVAAIGGGFSSGKSAFINSFIKDKAIRLPEGVKPVTAIPSYVTHAPTSRVIGYSNTGGAFDLDMEQHGGFSHDFIKSFEFNLKELMPYLNVATPLDESLFSNLCLIDTPGYNAADGHGYTGGDVHTAQEHIKEANFLIWLVGVDSNGTISETDLNFIEELSFGREKPLYIVCSKADLKPCRCCEEIINTIEDVLQDRDLQYEGISAYSSKDQSLISFRGKDLFSFLKEKNQTTNRLHTICKRLNRVFDQYKEAITSTLESVRGFRSGVNNILFNLVKGGIDIDSHEMNVIEARVRALQESVCSEADLDGQLCRVEELRIAFINCATNICIGR